MSNFLRGEFTDAELYVFVVFAVCILVLIVMTFSIKKRRM